METLSALPNSESNVATIEAQHKPFQDDPACEPYDPTSSVQREAYIRRVMGAIERFSKLPLLSEEEPDQIIGYNEYGHFD